MKYTNQLFNMIAILLCSLAVGMAAISFGLAGDQQELSQNCLVPGNARLLIGKSVFEIPSTLRGAHLDGKVFPKDNLADRICPDADRDIIEASGFSIETASLKDRTDADPDFSAQIIVRFMPEGAQDLILSDQAIKNADKKAGYLATDIRYPGTGGMGNSTFFVPINKKFRTPKLNSVIIGCYVGEYKRGRECYTWFAWSKKIQVNYKFYDGEYPISEWERLHYSILDFLKNLDVTNIKNQEK